MLTGDVIQEDLYYGDDEADDHSGGGGGGGAGLLRPGMYESKPSRYEVFEKFDASPAAAIGMSAVDSVLHELGLDFDVVVQSRAEASIDPVTANVLEDLEHRLDTALESENFGQAAALKKSIDKLKEIGTDITKSTQQKDYFIASERYMEAKEAASSIKDRMKQRQTIAKSHGLDTGILGKSKSPRSSKKEMRRDNKMRDREERDDLKYLDEDYDDNNDDGHDLGFDDDDRADEDEDEEDDDEALEDEDDNDDGDYDDDDNDDDDDDDEDEDEDENLANDDVEKPERDGEENDAQDDGEDGKMNNFEEKQGEEKETEEERDEGNGGGNDDDQAGSKMSKKSEKAKRGRKRKKEAKEADEDGEDEPGVDDPLGEKIQARLLEESKDGEDDLPPPSRPAKRIWKDVELLIPTFGEMCIRCMYSRNWKLRMIAADVVKDNIHKLRGDALEIIKMLVIFHNKTLSDKNPRVLVSGIRLVCRCFDEDPQSTVDATDRGALDGNFAITDCKIADVRKFVDALMSLLITQASSSHMIVRKEAAKAIFFLAEQSMIGKSDLLGSAWNENWIGTDRIEIDAFALKHYSPPHPFDSQANNSLGHILRGGGKSLLHGYDGRSSAADSSSSETFSKSLVSAANARSQLNASLAWLCVRCNTLTKTCAHLPSTCSWNSTSLSDTRASSGRSFSSTWGTQGRM